MLRPIIVPIGPSIAYLPLTQGQIACIDIEDIPLVDGYNWFADKDSTTDKFYAKAVFPGQGRKRMHDVIFGKKEGYTVDHIYCERSLDNRRANLRHATPKEQARNRRIRKDSTSGFKGVSWHMHVKKWGARIHLDGKLRHLGYFSTPEEAHAAYKEKANENWGEFSRTS